MNELLAKAAELDAAGRYEEADAITKDLHRLAEDQTLPLAPITNAPHNPHDMRWKFDALQKGTITPQVAQLWKGIEGVLQTQDYGKAHDLTRVLADALMRVKQLSATASAGSQVKVADMPMNIPGLGMTTPPQLMATPPGQVANPAHLAANRQALQSALTLLQTSLSSSPAGMPAVLSQLIMQMKQFLQMR